MSRMTKELRPGQNLLLFKPYRTGTREEEEEEEEEEEKSRLTRRRGCMSISLAPAHATPRKRKIYASPPAFSVLARLGIRDGRHTWTNSRCA